MKRFFGILMLLMGTAFAGWILYDHLSGQANENQRSPLGGVGLCLGLFIVGIKWVRGSPETREVTEASHITSRLAHNLTAVPGPASKARDVPRRRAVTNVSGGINLDLSKFTVAGWGLFFATLASVPLQALCVVLWLPDAEKLFDDQLSRALIGLVGVGLTVGFFLLGKFVLTRLGFLIYKRE